MITNTQFIADLLKLTRGTLNGKYYFSCSERNSYTK